jgi:hypothetical protein
MYQKMCGSIMEEGNPAVHETGMTVENSMGSEVCIYMCG